MGRYSRKSVNRLTSKVIDILAKKGEAAYIRAKEIILNMRIDCELLRDAVNYFIKGKREIQHPGLLSIACEAVGGDPNSVTDIGAAIFLILAGVHIHDDIIDETRYKDGRLTVYGKFGKDIALLAGDAFLFEGLTSLFNFCQRLDDNKKKRILELIRTSFFEIGNGEAYEIAFRRKKCMSPKSCIEYLKMRAAVAEAVMKIGGIVGNGEDSIVENLGHYGRTLGFLSAIRDEFIDIYELEESKRGETCRCMPLPLLFVLQDSSMREKILRLLRKKKLTEVDICVLVDIVMENPAVYKLKKTMKGLVDQQLHLIRKANITKDAKLNLELILISVVEDL